MLDDELGAGQRRCFLGDGVGFGGFLELGQQLARHLLGFETLLSVREALPELDDAVQLLARLCGLFTGSYSGEGTSCPLLRSLGLGDLGRGVVEGALGLREFSG